MEWTLMQQQQPKVGHVRIHRTAEFKSQLVTLALEPDASVSGVAIAHGVNPNLLRRWIKESKLRHTPPAFVPVQLKNSPQRPVHAPAAHGQRIEVHMDRGELRIAFKVDSSQIVELGHMLHEVLR